MALKPSTHQRLMVRKLSSNFREAVSIETVTVCKPKAGEVCIKNKYVGVNAADINRTKGRHYGTQSLPFGVGVEGVGEIVEVGEGIKNLNVGQVVAYIDQYRSSYAEYTCVPTAGVFLIPEAKPEYVTLLVSGLTASISLDKAGRITAGETVLITAAAGGTGHLAVQWAKAADCHVIGTCSSDEKKKILEEIGCERVINYKKENIDEVLSTEYKKGVNVVWETIGGEVFQTCLKHLSVKGRLVIVGGISQYKSEEANFKWDVDLSNLPSQLLMKSAVIEGFFRAHYTDCYSTYLKHLIESLDAGKLKAVIDNGEKSTGTEFFGMEGIIKGVEYLHSGKNVGKVIVRIS